MIHLLSCFWMILGTSTDNSWVMNYPSEQPYANKSPAADLYISSLYWVVTTLTTIGYGDIRAFNYFEQIYTMGVEVFNCFLNSIIVPRYRILWFDNGHD